MKRGEAQQSALVSAIWHVIGAAVMSFMEKNSITGYSRFDELFRTLARSDCNLSLQDLTSRAFDFLININDIRHCIDLNHSVG
jgi:hypothetical protein